MPAITNPMDMSGRTVLVTGASSGIGRDTCVLLGELGAKVVLVARNRERLEETLSMMGEGGHHAVVKDLTEVEGITEWLIGTCAEVGKLDGMVHCAGISATQAVRYLDWEDVDRILSINLKAALALAKGLRHKKCRSSDGARLVLMSSAAGVSGYPGMSAYSASKAAIIGLTRSLAVELVRDGIRVNCVTPGLVATEMVSGLEESIGNFCSEQDHLLGVGKPRDVSQMIAFLLGETGNWITGQSFVLDGGLTA